MLKKTVDLTNCDQEPIHIPGSIQPHGVLLALQTANLEIVRASDNSADVIGLSPQQLLGQPLSVLFNSSILSQIQQCLQDDFEFINPLNLSLLNQEKSLWFDGIIHRSQEELIFELEPKDSYTDTNFFEFYHHVRGTIARIQKSPSLLEMCHTVVREIREITGFDRVMVYRFDPDGTGSIIAEDKSDIGTPYLDLRYPASDIPSQARRLYSLNWLRMIPDVNYQPVPLVTHQIEPLDMSLAGLRSVSPLHIEYLKNMGVAASMSISLIQDQKLWGLIACHHSTPKYLSYSVRTICEFIGQVMSLELAGKEANEDLDYKMQLKLLQTHLVESLSQSDYFIDGLVTGESDLLSLTNAAGVVVFNNDRCVALGKTPPESSLIDLLEWIKPQIQQNLFHTHTLAQLYPAATSYKERVSGVLALEISKVHRCYILWFRPEVIQTVSWGGNPNKPVEVTEDGTTRLSPRKSFTAWQETMRGQALPWKVYEIEAVNELRSLIVGIILRQADELAALNIELQRSNEELDSFAYIASHDLKEPLRGIHNYANFLMEDYTDVLDDAGINKLKTLVRLTQRMEDLINSLLHFSRLGRAELNRQPTDLNEVVRQAIATLKMSQPQTHVDFRLTNLLPTINCDRAQINELFTNLITNAIKYNDKPEKWVEIGSLPAEQVDLPSTLPIPPHTTLFFVRDNGIGIPPEYQQRIFQIFRRLHGRDDYGGGTGAGLTIARKIVERHGGQIWVQSTPGEGSTFYFMVPEEAN